MCKEGCDTCIFYYLDGFALLVHQTKWNVNWPSISYQALCKVGSATSSRETEGPKSSDEFSGHPYRHWETGALASRRETKKATVDGNSSSKSMHMTETEIPDRDLPPRCKLITAAWSFLRLIISLLSMEKQHDHHIRLEKSGWTSNGGRYLHPSNTCWHQTHLEAGAVGNGMPWNCSNSFFIKAHYHLRYQQSTSLRMT